MSRGPTVLLAKERPEWELFWDFNSVFICARPKGGSVSFTRHIGQPLNDELWIDLVLRLKVQSIQLFDERHKCIGFGEMERVVVVILRDGLVQEIALQI